MSVKIFATVQFILGKKHRCKCAFSATNGANFQNIQRTVVPIYGIVIVGNVELILLEDVFLIAPHRPKRHNMVDRVQG